MSSHNFNLVTVGEPREDGSARYDLSLFENAVWVAQCTIVTYPNMENYHLALNIEVHPDHRGRKLSAELMNRAVKMFGPVRVPRFLPEAAANSLKYWEGVTVNPDQDFDSMAERLEAMDAFFLEGNTLTSFDATIENRPYSAEIISLTDRGDHYDWKKSPLPDFLFSCYVNARLEEEIERGNPPIVFGVPPIHQA